MALNALQADMVRFTGTPGVEVNGIIVGYRAEYTPRTSTDPKYNRLIDNKHSSNIDYSGQYYVQLGEELYNGDLTKKHVTDDFERPSYNWQFKGKEIGTYVDYTVLVNGGTFTEAVKYSELYELLTYTSINDNDISLFEDGVQLTVSKSQFSRSNKSEIGGQGVLTEVFLDRDRKQITITSINTYLAQANSDYNATNETLSLKVYQSSATGSTKIVDSKDVPEAANVVKDDYRLVYMSGKENATSLTDYARFDVVKMFNVDIMAESSVTKWSKVGATSAKVVDKLTTGGTEYKSNPKAFYDKGNVFDDYNEQLLTDTSYNIYMDRYGNVIGVDLFEGTKNYVFITGYDRGISHISIKTADAAAIFMDGTMDTITVNVTDTDKNIENAQKGSTAYNEYSKWTNIPDGDIDHNRWYTYTQSSNGTYTLKPVKNFAFTSYTGLTDANPKTLNSANLFLDDSGVTGKGRFYGNDDSVYLTVTPGRVDKSAAEPAKDAITDVEGVYTGAQDVKLDLKPSAKQQVNDNKTGDPEQNAYVYSIFNSNYYIIASIVMGEAQGATTNYIYTLSGAKSERVEHGSDSRAATDDTYYWEVDAVVNGEKTTLTVKSKFHETVDVINANKYMLVKVRYDGEYVNKIEAVNPKDVFTNQFSMAKIDDMKVYDVGNQAGGVDWASDTVGYAHNVAAGLINPDLGTYVDNANGKRIDGVIQLVGRTLYTDRANGDVGLALASDAKAVLVQPENGKIESVSCSSVAEAVGRLADENPATADKEFEGRVVAVLDGNGVAKWVVIISDTNLVTGLGPNYGYESSVDFGNVRIIVYNMTTKNVSGMIGADNKLYITLPNSLARAVDPEMYSVTVNINGAEVGKAVYYSETATTVTYVFDKVPVSYNGNMQIVVTVIPKGTTEPVDPQPPVTAKALKSLAVSGVSANYTDAKDLPKTVTVSGVDADGKTVTGLTGTVVWGTPDATTGKVTGTVTVGGLNTQTQKIDATTTVTGATNTNGKITVETVVKAGAVSGDIKVTITGASAPYTIKVSYTGKPSDKEIIDAINAQLVKDKKTEVAATISRGHAWDAANKDVGAITTVVSYNIYVNNVQLKDADGKAVTFSSETNAPIPVTYAGSAAFLGNKDNWAKGYAVSGTISKSASIPYADVTSLEKDLYLVDAYQLATAAATVASVTYNDGTEHTVTQSNLGTSSGKTALYVPKTGSVTVTGIVTTATPATGTHVKLTIAGQDYASKAVAATAAKYTVSMADLKDNMFSAAGVIGSIAEAETSSYTVKIDGATLTCNSLTSPISITLKNTDPEITDGKYIVKSTAKHETSADNIITVAGGKTTTLTLTKGSGDFTADSKGVIELVPVTKVTFAVGGSLNMVYNDGGTDQAISAGDVYFVSGTPVQFAPAANETSDWKATVKVGSADAAPLNGTSFTPSGTDDVIVTLLKGVKTVAVTGTQIAKPADGTPYTVATATAAVKNLVTIPNSEFAAAATTELEDSAFVAGATGLACKVTLTPATGYYFTDNAAVSTYPVTHNADGSISFNMSVSVASA